MQHDMLCMSVYTLEFLEQFYQLSPVAVVRHDIIIVVIIISVPHTYMPTRMPFSLHPCRYLSI